MRQAGYIEVSGGTEVSSAHLIDLVCEASRVYRGIFVDPGSVQVKPSQADLSRQPCPYLHPHVGLVQYE